jgi:hypothetical protein
MKRMIAAALLLFVAACAPAPIASPPPLPPPAALNPVGVFEFTTAVDGNEVRGSVEVTGQPGAYGGTVRTSITPDIPVTGVTVTGQTLLVAASTPDGPLTFALTFNGDAFTGRWELNGDGGDVTGHRHPVAVEQDSSHHAAQEGRRRCCLRAST